MLGQQRAALHRTLVAELWPWAWAQGREHLARAFECWTLLMVGRAFLAWLVSAPRRASQVWWVPRRDRESEPRPGPLSLQPRRLACLPASDPGSQPVESLERPAALASHSPRISASPELWALTNVLPSRRWLSQELVGPGCLLLSQGSQQLPAAGSSRPRRPAVGAQRTLQAQGTRWRVLNGWPSPAVHS